MIKKNRAAAFGLALSILLPVGTEAIAARTVPIAENLELTTQVNTSVEGSFAAHVDAEEPLTYRITTEPRKGEIRLLDNGRFLYTPRTNKKGKDYFGYRATDNEGNTSEEGTVLIRIEKRPEAEYPAENVSAS